MQGHTVDAKGQQRQVETDRHKAGQTSPSSTSSRQVPGCFFANPGVGSGDDDCFPIQPLLGRPAVAAHAPAWHTHTQVKHQGRKAMNSTSTIGEGTSFHCFCWQ